MHSVDSLDVSTWWAHVLMNMPNFCVLGTVAERGIWDDVICQHAGREADTHVRHKCKSDKKNENHTVQKPFKCLSLSLSLLISILLCSSEIKNRILHVCKHRVSCKSKTEREYQICEQSSSCDLCTVCFQANKQNAASKSMDVNNSVPKTKTGTVLLATTFLNTANICRWQMGASPFSHHMQCAVRFFKSGVT